MRTVAFFNLSRSLQDRFVGSAGGAFEPLPIAQRREEPKTHLVYAGAAAAAVAFVLIVFSVGYGNLESSLSNHGVIALLLYVAAFGALVFFVIWSLAARIRVRKLPYRPGVYVFPMVLIDARAEKFVAYSMLGAQVGASGSQLSVTPVGGPPFGFPCGDAAKAQSLVAAIHEEQARSKEAEERGDPAELITLDPLHEPRFSSPVAPRVPYAPSVPEWARLRIVVAVVAAITLGPVTWILRNLGSDERLYISARKADTVQSYKDYLERGHRHSNEVTSEHLPRAELRVAVADGSVEAMRAYVASHPTTTIPDEVNGAVRSAELHALEAAKADGSLASLTAFAKKYPDHKVSPELRVAMHDVYQRELRTYLVKAAKNPEVRAFAERLFAAVEKHGPKVILRVRIRPPTSFGRADKYVLKTPTFMGEVSYPSRYFDNPHNTARAKELAERIRGRFAEVFPKELFEFVVEAPQESADAMPPPGDPAPVLAITYLAEWSTHTYENKKDPRGTFIGITYTYDSKFYAADAGKPLSFKSEIWRGAALGAAKEPGEGSQEERAYAAMARDANGIFVDRYGALWFAKTK